MRAVKLLGIRFARMVAVFGVMSAGVGWSAAYAENVTLTDNNSSIKIDLEDGGGAYDWQVDEQEGESHLYQQWFWCRVGNSGPETRLDDLRMVYDENGDNPYVIDTNPFSDSEDDTLNVVYEEDVEGPRFQVDVTYVLRGGAHGSGTADLTEIVRVDNLTEGDLVFHLFEYSDFELDGTEIDQSVQILGGALAVQSGTGSPYYTESRTGAVPLPSRYQVASNAEGDDSPIWESLEDEYTTTLNNTATAGPGDLSWAFQWDVTIPAEGTFLMSKNKIIYSGSSALLIPEPSTLVMASIGLLILGGYAIRRRRRRA